MIIDKVAPDFSFATDKTEQKQDNASGFGKYLKDALDSANDAQIKSDQETVDMLSGGEEDMHQVLLSASEARIQYELVMEIRNKLLDSYQEINRMQI